MITLSVLAITGMIGLSVDLGWSFFVKRQAQAASDGAAQAAILVAASLNPLAFKAAGFCSANPSYCAAAPTDCASISPGSNLDSGCQYALRNGFSTGGQGGRQNVTIQAQANDGSSPPPTVPGVTNAVYWVTVRATQTVPQLFSAVFGNTQGLVAARSTTAILNTAVPGQIITLNQRGDCDSVDKKGDPDDPLDFCGLNFYLQKKAEIRAFGNLLLASECNAKGAGKGKGGKYEGKDKTCAGRSGTADDMTDVLASPGTVLIHGQGTADDVFLPWLNGQSGNLFTDPTQGIPQPPIVANFPVKSCGIPGGMVLGGSKGSPVQLGPYNYYALPPFGLVPTGEPIQIKTYANFGATGCPGLLSIEGTAQTSTFPTYFFHGGLDVQKGTDITLGPGQYVMVGGLPAASVPTVFAAGGNDATLQSSGDGPGYAGNMFILTDPGYPGLAAQIGISGVSGAWAAGLRFGVMEFAYGNKGSITLSGLKAAVGGVPASLAPYNGILIWQDRRNSNVKMDPNTAIPDCSSGSCVNTALLNPGSPAMFFSRKGDTLLDGVIYQPRGAWVSVKGLKGEGACDKGKYQMFRGPIQIITGMLKMEGGCMDLESPLTPLTRYISAQIE